MTISTRCCRRCWNCISGCWKRQKKAGLRTGFFYAGVLCVIYFNFASASLIRPQAFSILGMLFAKENRTQAGSPKASPITEETCALLSRYMLKSAELLIVVVPSDLP